MMSASELEERKEGECTDLERGLHCENCRHFLDCVYDEEEIDERNH